MVMFILLFRLNDKGGTIITMPVQSFVGSIESGKTAISERQSEEPNDNSVLLCSAHFTLLGNI